MDWSRAKNILIIAFIITNIFLIYNISREMLNSHSLDMIQDESIENIVNILEEKKIIVNTNIPKKIFKMPVLNLEYEINDEWNIEQIISNYNNHLNIKTLNLKKLKEISDDFLKQNNLLDENVEYRNITYDGDRYIVEYNQKYKNYFLEDSYMKVAVSKLGILSLDRKWFKALSESKNKKEIMPATKALLKFMKNTQNDDMIIIEDISLGYWLDSSQINFNNEINNSNKTSLPAWKIVLNDGSSKFIIAYDYY